MDHATFTRTTAERAGVPLTTVREAVTPREFDDVLSQLPQEYRELVGPMA
jgi:uncharacterized protein (DUF2267 family)